MRKGRFLLISTMLLTILSGTVTFADPDIKIKRAYCTDNEAVLYVDGESSNDDVSYQIGNVLCEDIKTESLDESGLPFRSLIMVDNSLSISQEDREKESAPALQSG